MKKYLVNNIQIEATSANDAVKKYKLGDTDRFPDYVGTPSMSPDIMYSYIVYINDAIKHNNKKIANFYIDKLVSAYYDYDKLEDDFKRFINEYSKAMNDVHTKMRAFQSQVYQMKDSVKDGWLNVRGTTSQGYEVRAIYNGRSGRLYAVIYRPRTNDFLVAAGYNQLRGDWAQGYYDFKSEDQARKFAEKHARQMGDSVKDSDKLKQMAYKFAQMGNYFDRANSVNSRKILAKEDDQKYAEFYNFALQVYQQLKTEVDGAKKNAIPKRYRLSYDNQTLNLLNDGTSRLYWAAEDRRDNKGEFISKKIRELVNEYKNAVYDSVKDEPDMETTSGRQSYYLQQIMAAIDILDSRMWNHAGTKVNVDNNNITLLATSDGIKIINAKTGKTIVVKSKEEVENYLRQNVN